jgi:hypothetical protein
MPYIETSPNRLVKGALTPEDRPAILATLAAAGLNVDPADPDAITCTVTDSGNAFFVHNRSGRDNGIRDRDLRDRVASALDEAGWVMLSQTIEVLGLPVPRHLWTIDQVAQHLGTKVSSARGQLSRWTLAAYDYRRGGTSGRPQGRFDADLVRALADIRPGQGARTDLA